MRRTAMIFYGILILLGCLNAQSFLTHDDYLINGYARKISGLDYDYQSCIPGLRESMLLRATSGKDFIEWETDPIPEHIDRLYATFIWFLPWDQVREKPEWIVLLMS
jgi:hypothetical protein